MFSHCGLEMSNTSVLETFEPSPLASHNAHSHRSAESEATSWGKIQFSAKGRSSVLVPYWNFCSAAGRANEGLRAGWREHLQLVSKNCGFRYLRFHGLLHDDMFVCRRQNGALVFNWQYIDDLIDALLAHGVRPFLEFGFFPKDLAGESEVRCFWWQAHVTPPEHYRDWCVLVDKLVRHFIQRYGAKEVRQWYFEVWNEPNLWFFFNSTRTKYFELYRATVATVKSIDPSLKVGGPATSNFVPDDRFGGERQAGEKSVTGQLKNLGDVEWRGVWIREFLEFCECERLPVDFVSAHPYPTDIPFGHEVDGMRTRPADSTLRDLQWLRQIVNQSAFPSAEIHLTEWSTSPSARDFTHDFPQSAAYIIKTNIEASGLVDSLAYWTFTDVFEEHGAGDSAFHGGFGLINYQGIVKPAFHAYRFLNQLGEEEIFRADGLLATRTKSAGRLRAVLCHFPSEHPDAPPFAGSLEAAERTLATGAPITREIEIQHLPPNAAVLVETVDAAHGFALRQWQAMGSPSSPTPDQILLLRKFAWDTHRQIVSAKKNGVLNLRLSLAPWAVALLREIE
jgi:xylan 1,4-beta-xylosidase